MLCSPLRLQERNGSSECFNVLCFWRLPIFDFLLETAVGWTLILLLVFPTKELPKEWSAAILWFSVSFWYRLKNFKIALLNSRFFACTENEGYGRKVRSNRVKKVCSLKKSHVRVKLRATSVEWGLRPLNEGHGRWMRATAAGWGLRPVNEGYGR